MLRRIERDTRTLCGSKPDDYGAQWPRDYHRPYALLQLWRRPGARYFPTMPMQGR